MAGLSLQNVSKVHPNGVAAVADFSLVIPDGQFTVLVGPSGCGKTTTLRLIAGLDEPSGGEIRIGARTVNEVAPKDRDIAMVFQNYALYPHMTVYKNMSFALKLRGVPRADIDRRVRSTAAMLGIEDLLDRRPRALSGGQRQRVAVGRAIVREPAAFLFDEPLSNLDAKLRVTTRAELKALHQRLKTTTVYVTHDQEEAMTLGDRVVVMYRGRIQQAAPPLEVYRRPANRFVASFVGTPPMNFLDGTVQRGAGGLEFVTVPGGQASVAIPIPVSTPSLDSRIGSPVVAGVRPQHFSEVGDPGPSRQPNASLKLTVRVVEPLGDTMDVHGTVGDHQLVARLRARAGVEVGQALRLTLEPEKCHFFEPGEFGASLIDRTV
jgi:multiple sugar transport system ATP-binding protein